MPKITDERRAERRLQIVHAAMKCVSEQGFHKTTMADVIRESGMSAGAVYGYFRNKEELIVAIADKATSLADRTIGTLLEADPLPTLPEMVEHLTTAVTAHEQGEQGDLTRVAVVVWAEAIRDDAVRALVTARFQGIRHRYAELVRAQQRAGRLDPEEDPELVARALFGLMPGFILQRLLIGDIDPGSYARAVRGLLRISETP
ncbi:TetR/AcrR family transcriptional regulator [Nocardiopsis sp. Huas11]|uniref:TetR/AcrR family transcriptional regulator n=1 Tax=Nocardiopsis sp. Huas11 TaxID=2183912 RepID=UPI0013152962|nr:TetR/AcrR family transcriptional regulator [Nocardiopsis sp. Huas11]